MKTENLLRFLALTTVLFLCAFAPLHLGAQTASAATGVITGRVLNEAAGTFLANVVLAVEGEGRSVVSGADGTFTLVAPAGNRVLVATYAGLDEARVPVVVGASPASIEVRMTSKIYALETFFVEGVREENSLALQAQRTAPNAKTVVAVGAFGNPAVNPGEMLQRLPGTAIEYIAGEPARLYVRGLDPAFSQLLVDGEPVAVSFGNAAQGRVFMMNQYATTNLSQIELIKAPTPDQDANAIAGFVNFETKKGFDRARRQLRFSFGGIGTDREFGRGNFQDKFRLGEVVSFSYAEALGVLGGAKNLGVSLTYSRRDGNRLLEEIGPGIIGGNIAAAYVNATSANPLTRLFGTGDFTSAAVTDTYGLRLDYRFTPRASGYISAGLTTHENGPQQAFRNVIGNPAATAAQFAAGSTYEFSTQLPSAASVARNRSFSGNRFNNTRNFGAGWDQQLFDRSVTVVFKASYSIAHSYNPYTTQIDAVATGIGYSLDRRGQDPWYPVFTQTAGPSVFDPASYLIQNFQRQNPGLRTPRESYRVDVKKDFATRVPFYVKAGAKTVFEKRVIDRSWEQFTFVGADGVANSTDDRVSLFPFEQRRNTRRGYGPYPFLPIPDNSAGNPLDPPNSFGLPFGTSRGNLWAVTAADAYTSYANSLAVNSLISEQTDSAYAMGNVHLGKLRLLGGVRFEKTTVKAGAWERNTTASWGGNSVGGASVVPATVAANVARAARSFVRFRKTSNGYDHWFPGLHAVHEPAPGLLLRASYNRSIARPPVNSLLPTSTLNEDTLSATLGNPDLAPYTADNFDLGIEKYFEPLGRVGVGVFRKNLESYFRTFQFTAGPAGIDGDPRYAGYSISRPENIGSARIQGYEISFQRRLGDWLPWTKNVSVFANYSRTQAEGNFGDTATTSKLEFLTPHSANAGLAFQSRRFDIRLLGNYQGRQFAGSVSGIDFYRRDRVLTDLKLQFNFSKRWQAYADLNNLFNTQQRADITDNGLRWQQLHSGTSYTLGVTLDL